jgi:ATP-binding cassette subfamily B protein
LIGAVVMLAAIDLRAGGLLAVWLVVYLTFLRVMLLRVRARSKARAAARAAVTGVVVDTITNIKTVKLFASSAHEDRAALSAMADFREKALAFGILSAWFRFGLIAIAGLLPVLLIGTSLYFWTQGTVSPGDIAAAGAISLRIGQMTGWVSFTLMALYSNIGEIEDGVATLTPPHALSDRPDAIKIDGSMGAVRYEGVQFQYGRAAGGLSSFDLDIAPGQKIALVGQSGAGKSTAVSLLLRLYDPEAGRITLDGRDLRDITQESLRSQIATVTQETAMFNRSALDNILYGRPGATREEVEEAARQASAHDFIVGLEDHQGRTGYDAHLGERGVKLSGGQRQRIALARAILKDAPVLVLDEATSALDSETEADVQAALEGLMEGRTVIAIAHRLSTIAAMDRIIVLQDGEIVEQGTHTELLSKAGRYAQFWAHQSGGFLRLDAAE